MPHLAFRSSLCVVGPKAKFSKLKIWKMESHLKGTKLVGCEGDTSGTWRGGSWSGGSRGRKATSNLGCDLGLHSVGRMNPLPALQSPGLG